MTLGIYGFWARTEVRKRIWSGVRIEGEPLHYTGTGKELFLGFLIVFFLRARPLHDRDDGRGHGIRAGIGRDEHLHARPYVVTFLLIGVAIYRAQRYRLSRTRWRAIRGALVGSPNSYAWTYFWTGIVSVLSLGWALPWRSTKLQGIMTRDTRFGSEPFRFDASLGPLYARFARAMGRCHHYLWRHGSWHRQGARAVRPRHALGGEGSPFQLGPDGKMMPTPRTIGMIVRHHFPGHDGVLGFRRLVPRQPDPALRQPYRTSTAPRSRRTLSTAGLIWVSVSNVFIVLGTLGILAPIAQGAAGAAIWSTIWRLPARYALPRSHRRPSRTSVTEKDWRRHSMSTAF